MNIIGSEARAKQARAAANRLRWEVDWELGAGDQVPARDTPGRLSTGTVSEIAEALAIYRQILDTINTFAAPDDPVREQFRNSLLFYKDFHEVAR